MAVCSHAQVHIGFCIVVYPCMCMGCGSSGFYYPQVYHRHPGALNSPVSHPRVLRETMSDGRGGLRMLAVTRVGSSFSVPGVWATKEGDRPCASWPWNTAFPVGWPCILSRLLVQTSLGLLLLPGHPDQGLTRCLTSVEPFWRSLWSTTWNISYNQPPF